ncbi:Elg1 protein [Pichia kluyveri]|uniref:Elg1 protein n=1 Tax=Pichia kluyveri TaxID=36015 RepID=A0AAV5R329_PICKL|nr:Elg1 protein [Pichia kluyveri]
MTSNTGQKTFTPAELLMTRNKPPIQSITPNQLIQTRPSNPSSMNDLKKLLSGNKPIKKSLLVTLKIPKRSLIVKFKYKSINKCKPSQIQHPFFKQIFNKFNNKDNNKDKNKSIPSINNIWSYPKLHASEFKIRNLNLDEERLYSSLTSIDLPLIIRSKPVVNLEINEIDYLIYYQGISHNTPNNDQYCLTVDDEIIDPINTFLSLSKLQKKDIGKYNKFFNNEYIQTTSLNNYSQWCDIYKPLNHLENLQSNFISNDVFNWIQNSFMKLKSVNKEKRIEKLSYKKKKVDPFIIYDEESDDEDFIVPSLIIEGPIGCGKTSMIYSIVDNELNGFVFEFNSSKSRARKDLEFTIKQIGTTSMVSNCERPNENTLILFDDVDLIDNNEMDKDFWIGLNNLLTISYRPVVLITNDLNKIPKNIVNESTIIKFNAIDERKLFKYLKLISLSRNINIDDQILKEFAKLDLRKALMELQMFSYNFQLSNVGLNNITLIKEEINEENNLTNLRKLELKSINDDLQYYNDQINKDNYTERSIEDFNTLRYSYTEFYSSKLFSNGSRSKKCRYNDGNHYNSKHPTNIFQTLSQDKLSTEVFPIIDTMAEMETLRIDSELPRRFDAYPIDIF